MPRARLLHPEFARHEGLAELSHTHRLLFAMLPMIADREGLIEDRPKRIKTDLFPYDAELAPDQVDMLLTGLAGAGFIVRYVVDGIHCIYIPGFKRWQRPHPREKASELPRPPRGKVAPRLALDSPKVSSGDGLPPYPVSVSVSDPVPKEKQEHTQRARARPTTFVGFIESTWRDIADPAGYESRAQEAFLEIDLLAEAQKALGWEQASPKNKRTDHGSFLWSWLLKAQERAGKTAGTSSPKKRNGAAQLQVSKHGPPGRKYL